MAEGEQINTEQTRLDKIDKKIDKKVMVKGKDYAEIVIKKVDAIEEKLKSNFGIKEQIILDSPKFKESKTKAFSDTYAILRGIDEKNIDELTSKLDQKLKDIEKGFIPFSAEEVKITKFKNDLADFNSYMEKRRGLEKSGKFKEAQNLTNEYQSKHVVATETASPIETANYLASKKYQEVKNTLGDSEKISELLRMAQGYVDQANEERKFEQQEGFRVGYMVQGSNRHSEKSAVGLPSDLAQSTDKGSEKEVIDIAAVVEINPEKGVRIVMTAACTDATRVELKELGVAEGWVKPAVLRKAISVFAMKFSHCEEGTTRCVTPKKEGKSIETEAQAKALVDEANILKAKVEITALMDKTLIASKRAIEALGGNIMSKDGKVSFTPKFLADFENLTIEQKKSGIKMAQDSLLKASIIEATEKAEDPVSKHFHLGREALQNGDLPGARFRFNQFLDEVSRQQDRPEIKDMIVFAKEQIRTFNIASIKRLQRINDQLSDSKRYEALFKDHANERFLYNFIAKNKANLEFQLQQIEAGTIEAKAQGASLVQRKEQTISATPIVGPDGSAPSMQEKDNSDKLMDAWNSLVYAEFSTGIESDKGKIQDEYLSAARSLRSLGQPDIASEYFEAAMKEDIDRVRGSISAAQKEQMRTKIINENEKKRSTYETTIRKKIWGEIEEFNAKRPPEQQKPLEISATELTSLVDEAMAEGVEEKMKKAVMHGMEVANDKGELEKGGKKAWSEYESMMDVNDKWYIISDKEAEKIAEQVFINGVIMAISGGVGSLAAASVRAYMIANGIRSGLALGAAGFVAESTGFELANRGIRTTILKEKGLFMPIELAKGIGQSMLMFGSIGAGNKGWSAVSKATGLATEEAIATAGTTEKLLRTGADKSGELTVRASMKKASDDVVEESLGKITGRTIRKGLDWSGQLATEAAIFSATSDNSFIESAGDIIMLRIGGKFVSPITGAMHDAGRKIIEEGAKKGQEKDMSMPVGAIDNPVGEVGETSVKPETSQEALQDQHEQSSTSNSPSPSITDGPQYDAKEMQDRYEQLAKKGFGPYLQMLAANLHFDPNTGKELATTQSRIDFAIQFDAKTHWDESGDHKLSSEGAARTMLEKRRTPASNSLLHDYLVQKMGIDEVRAKQIIHERMDEGRVQADKLKPQDIDFLKNSEFDGNPPQQSYIKYKQGKKIILPDCNGRMQEFTVGFNPEYKEFVKIYSKSGIEYKIKKGFVDKYNKPELSDMMYTVGDMFGRVVDKITWNTTLAITIINMRGDLYPAMIQGKLRWMLKPQAWRVTMDPRQDEAENYFGDENKYNRVYEDLEKQGKKYILDEDLPTGAPSVQLQVGGLQMLNHHRLMGTRHVPIEVKLTNFSTFN